MLKLYSLNAVVDILMVLYSILPHFNESLKLLLPKLAGGEFGGFVLLVEIIT